MAVLTNTMLQGTAAVSSSDDGYQIKNSINLNHDGPAYGSNDTSWTPSVYDKTERGRLNRFLTHDGDTRRWTFSCWVKRTDVAKARDCWLWSSNKDSADNAGFRIKQADENLYWQDYTGGGGTVYKLESVAGYRDPHGWMHIVLAYDSNHATASERTKMYVNGERVIDFDTADYPARYHRSYNNRRQLADLDAVCGAEMSHAWGVTGEGRGGHADYMFLDGVVLTPLSFGSWDSLGVWNPRSFRRHSPLDGTNFTSTGTSSGTWANAAGSGGVSQIFDGDITTLAYAAGGADTYATFEFETPIPFSTLRVYAGEHGTADTQILINDVNLREDFAWDVAGSWVDITSARQKIGNELKKFALKDKGGQSTNIRAIEVDGRILKDGEKDTTNTTNPNDGTKWSDYLVSSTGAFYGSMPATQAFDGHENLAADASSQGATMTWTPPSVITFIDKVELKAGGGQGGTQTITLTDSSDATTSVESTVTDEYTTVKTGGGTLKSLALSVTAGNYSSWYALRIDGYVYQDCANNSYHLKFEDDTDQQTLGENSFETINYTSVNAAKGAPILKTNKVGSAVTSGYRTDTHAGTTNNEGLVLAIPGNSVASGTCDVHQGINTGSSNKAVTLIGDPTVDTSKSRFYGKSIAFNGDDGLSFAGDADFDWGTYTSGTDGDFTLETWIKFNNIGASGSIFDFVDNDGNNSPAGSWFFSSSRGLEWYLGGSNVAIAPAKFSSNAWHHIALVRTGGNLKHFLDGKIEASGSFTGQCGISNKALTIGKFASSSIFFNGSINDFRIYKGVAKYTADFIPDNRKDYKGNSVNLTTVEIPQNAGPIRKTDSDGTGVRTGFNADPLAEYLVFACPCSDGEDGLDLVDYAPTIKGDGSSAKSITNNGLAVATSGKWYGDSAESDGNDYATCQSSDFELSTTDDFTLEFWTYIPTSGLTTHARIFNMSDTSENGLSFAVYSGGEIYPMILGDYIITGGSGTNLTDSAWQNAWAHWAITRKDGICYWFLNGALKAQEANTTALPASQNTMHICAAGYHTAMKISDVRFYKGVAKYTGTFAIPAQVQPDKRYKVKSFDSPTAYSDTNDRGNYCTLSELDKHSELTLSNANLSVTNTTANWRTVRGTMAVSSGKWYYEVEHVRAVKALTGMRCGWTSITDKAALDTDTYATKSYGYYNNGGSGRTEYNSTVDTANVDGFGVGDVIGCAIDLDNDKIWWSKNGTWMNSGNPATGAVSRYTVTEDTYVPYIATAGVDETAHANFGQLGFKYTVPDGFKALCSVNAPDIFGENDKNNPSKYFDIKNWTGTGAENIIKGFNFQPDFTWIKASDNADQHALFNVVRGATKKVYTSATNAEVTDAQTLKAWNSDGFTLGTEGGVNLANKQFISWNWDAGTTNSGANEDGDINISAGNQWVNNIAGFSITVFEGNGSANQTVGHGLNAAPKVVMLKPLESADNWPVWFDGFGTNGYVYTGSSAAKATYDPTWGSVPTNEVFGVSNNNNYNKSGEDFIAYCWTPIKGFSSFGHYKGNANVEGEFCNCGFKPKFVLVKGNNFAGNWNLFDSVRNPSNPCNFRLFPNSNAVSAADSATGNRVTMCTNGFQIHGSNADINNSGSTFFYMAFAEYPEHIARAS